MGKKKSSSLQTTGGSTSFSLWDQRGKISSQYLVWSQRVEGPSLTVDEKAKEVEATKFMSVAAKEKLKSAAAAADTSPCLLDVHGVLLSLIYAGPGATTRGSRCPSSSCGDRTSDLSVGVVLKERRDVALVVALGNMLAFTPQEFDLSPTAVLGKEPSGAKVLRYNVIATYSFCTSLYWGKDNTQQRAESGAKSRTGTRPGGHREPEKEATNQKYWAKVIQKQLDVEFKDGEDVCRLLLGVGYLGNMEGFARYTLKRLLDRGVSFKGNDSASTKNPKLLKNEYWCSLIRAVVFAGHLDFLKYLLSFMEDVLHLNSDETMLRVLNPYAPHNSDGRCHQGRCGDDGLLNLAVAGGSLSMVRFLVNRFGPAAEHRWKDQRGHLYNKPMVDLSWGLNGTALETAVRRGNKEMIYALVKEIGATVDEQEIYAFALQHAGDSSSTETYHNNCRQFAHWYSSTSHCRYVEFSAAMPRRTMTILRALVQATGKSSTDVFDVLSGVRVGPKFELTLLHALRTAPQAFEVLWSGLEDDVEDRIGKKLILHWVSVASKVEGLYPLQHWAKTNSPMHCYGYLRALQKEDVRIDGVLPINQQSESGATALTWACSAGFVEIVKILLDLGAVTSLKDRDGYTALDWYHHVVSEKGFHVDAEVVQALEVRMRLEAEAQRRGSNFAQVEAVALACVPKKDYVKLGKPPEGDRKWRNDDYGTYQDVYRTWEEFYNSFFEYKEAVRV